MLHKKAWTQTGLFLYKSLRLSRRYELKFMHIRVILQTIYNQFMNIEIGGI